MNGHRDNQIPEDSASHLSHEVDWFDRQPTLPLPICEIDHLSKQVELRTIKVWLTTSRFQDAWSIDELPTIITPAIDKLGLSTADIPDISTVPIAITNPVTVSQQSIRSNKESYVKLLRKHIKTAGIYAVASVVTPLVSLILAPFLTRTLSLTDYGILTVLTTFISLVAGITSLGLSSAFFRAYGYDYTSSDERRNVLATTTSLLCLISIVTVVGGVILAPFIAEFLFGRPSLDSYVTLAIGVICLQNLTIPAFAWMRAESHALFFSLLSIVSLFITLIANLFLVGMLHLGIGGAVIAIGSGYAAVIVAMLPIIIARAGLSIRVDIAKSMLTFGLPLVLNFVSYWVLQVSDRYLLSHLGSLAQTAVYAVAYSLGSVMSVLVIGPFTLAWPTSMFAIAKRKDAPQIFKLIFRWFSMFLLFAAFGLSLISNALLNWLFPVSYHSAALVIPLVATSMAFYGVYYVFTVGSNVTRKTWLAAVFTTIAAIVNIAVNLVLIPLYGALGAATSTLIAYIILAFAAYSVNQRIYPIPFEIGRFMVALLVGIAFYVGSSSLASSRGAVATYSLHFGALVLYGLCLFILARFPRGVRNDEYSIL